MDVRNNLKVCCRCALVHRVLLLAVLLTVCVTHPLTVLPAASWATYIVTNNTLLCVPACPCLTCSNVWLFARRAHSKM